MAKISINGLKIRAFHGVFPEEMDAGGDFLVNLTLIAPIESALFSDKLSDTLNYSYAVEVIKDCMSIPSKLLEHVAHRCINALQIAFPQSTEITIEIHKLHPPIGHSLTSVSVCVSWPQDYISPK
jgi:dihydroneopterin aldolase